MQLKKFKMNRSKTIRRFCLTLANWTRYCPGKTSQTLARSLVFLWHICFDFEDGDCCPDLRGLGPLCRGLQRPRQGRMSPQQASHSSVTTSQKALHHPHQQTKIRKGNYWLGWERNVKGKLAKIVSVTAGFFLTDKELVEGKIPVNNLDSTS